MLTQTILLSLVGSVLAAPPQIYLPKLDATYHGTLVGNVEHFQNIKYAQETSGQKRFAPPEPFVPKPGAIIEASSPGLSCPQMKEPIPPAFDETSEISEDCLHLRIARPTGLNGDEKIPVVVWLHGGGMVKGSAYDPHFVPDPLVELSIADGKPLIYASVNYRFTIFGFPSLQLLKEQKSMNLGLRDQRLGLEWIRDNIAAFGGDPNCVTIYGLSSGGTLSSLQLMAFGGEKPPFQQVWAMSGPPGTNLNMSTDGGLIHTQAVAKSLGCDVEDDSATLQCLRDAPMQELLDKAMEFARGNHAPHGLFTFLPTVDGDFFPDRPTELLKSGRFAKGIRVIFGWTQDDGAMNALPAQAIQTEDDMKAPIHKFVRLLTADQYERLFALYPTTDFEPELANYEARRAENDPAISIHFFRTSRILRDLLFTCSSLKYGYEMTKQSRKLDPNFDGVRLYDLNQTVYSPMLNAIGMPFVGTCHGSDTVYIFNGVFPEGPMTPGHSKLAELLSRSLINYAYTGSPVSDSSSQKQFDSWPPSFENTVEDGLPSQFLVQVIGGPYGTGPAQISRPKGGVGYFPGAAEYLNTLQHALPDVLGFGGMRSRKEVERQKQLAGEKLHQRCAYIDELSESLGI